jgi:hypothetical protein
MQKILILLLTLSLLNCANTATSDNKNTDNATKSTPTTPEFNAYWYAGKAELCRYELDQGRYGEMRKGNAVLVFVTEPFSKKKQVKLDNPEANPSDVSNVLKLNFSKKFDTGIYPYSILTSSFTPVDGSDKTLKVSCSVQEWCGHAFAQINKEKDGYRSNYFSYFESEGDQSDKISNAISEDGLWQTIRIDPTQLPLGKVAMIPSLAYLRLAHQPMKAVEATVVLEKSNFNQNPVNQYVITYPNRVLKIYFDEKFPFTIQGWEETYKERKTEMTTRGTLKKVLLSDYWSHNSLADDAMRVDFYK